MAKFNSQIEGNETVWDAKNDCVLCEFKDGVVETNDERTIKILTRLGYECISKEATVAKQEAQVTGEATEADNEQDDVNEADDDSIADESNDGQDLANASYKELQKIAKDRKIACVGVKHADLLKALEG